MNKFVNVTTMVVELLSYTRRNKKLVMKMQNFYFYVIELYQFLFCSFTIFSPRMGPDFPGIYMFMQSSTSFKILF